MLHLGEEPAMDGKEFRSVGVLAPRCGPFRAGKPKEKSGCSQEQEARGDIENQLRHRFINSSSRSFNARIRSLTMRALRS